MNFKENIEYSGDIFIEQEKLTFSIAEISDAKQIAEMYQKISIHYDNYKTRLNPLDDNSFYKEGGMFIVFNEEEIRNEILNTHSFWAVVKNEVGEIAASFWFADNNDYFHDYTYDLQGNNVFPRELIVASEYKTKNISKIIFYTIFCAMQKIGYDCSICDVYKVVQYEANGEKNTVGILNESSFNMVLNVGGTFLGAGEVRQINLHKLRVWIEPQIILFDYKEAIPYYEKILEESGTMIVWR